MDDIICQAIKARCLLEFRYDGDPRVVQPAALGVHRSTGNKTLRAYQVAGVTKSGDLPLWRLFTLRKITNLKALDRTFATPPPGYQPRDEKLHVICQL